LAISLNTKAIIQNINIKCKIYFYYFYPTENTSPEGISFAIIKTSWDKASKEEDFCHDRGK